LLIGTGLLVRAAKEWNFPNRGEPNR